MFSFTPAQASKQVLTEVLYFGPFYARKQTVMIFIFASIMQCLMACLQLVQRQKTLQIRASTCTTLKVVIIVQQLKTTLHRYCNVKIKLDIHQIFHSENLNFTFLQNCDPKTLSVLSYSYDAQCHCFNS